jgi:hypothetical protein
VSADNDEVAIGRSSDRGLTWSDSELPREGAGHMTLVREARHERGFGRRSA